MPASRLPLMYDRPIWRARGAGVPLAAHAPALMSDAMPLKLKSLKSMAMANGMPVAHCVKTVRTADDAGITFKLNVNALLVRMTCIVSPWMPDRSAPMSPMNSSDQKSSAAPRTRVFFGPMRTRAALRFADVISAMVVMSLRRWPT